MHTSSRLALALAAAFALGFGSARAADEAPKDGAAASAPTTPDGRQGIWVWEESWVADDARQDRLVRFAKEHGFNLLLVQVHLVGGSDGPRIKFPSELGRLVQRAAEEGIAVEALDGAPDQADAANQPHTLAILDAVIALNDSLPPDAKLAGMHYDIEPYTREEWNDVPRRQVIMRDLLTFYAAAKQRLAERAPGVTLSADIPMWYDNLEDASLEFAGQTKPLYQHIQDVCDYIGIMSYRRHATGPNSVVEHVTTEMDYAATIGKQVCPALETLELKDTPQITFYGQTAADFWQTHNAVRAHFADHPGFGGMLTHHVTSLEVLLAQ